MRWTGHSNFNAMFQFTHPGRGATYGHRPVVLHRGVSIHAPREGCDVLLIGLSGWSAMFQFTHPGRGATPIQGRPRE